MSGSFMPDTTKNCDSAHATRCRSWSGLTMALTKNWFLNLKSVSWSRAQTYAALLREAANEHEGDSSSDR